MIEVLRWDGSQASTASTRGQRASAVLTGEPGVARPVCSARSATGSRPLLPPASCHNATLGRRDFYRKLCVALGLSPSATAAAVFYAVSTMVEELAKERVHHRRLVAHDTAEDLRMRLRRAGCER